MCTLEGARATGRLGSVSRQATKAPSTLSSWRFCGLAALCCCSASPLTLNAPNLAPAAARDPTPVEIEPIAVTPTAGVVVGGYMSPGPAAVLTAAMSGELRGRALHGGEPGGYTVRCSLDRFATRTHSSVTDGQQMLTAYADLSCEAKRAKDGALVWRGELRGRACAAEPSVLGSDARATQRLADRALSDLAREMASDLAVRGLALLTAPSARVFADAEQQRLQMGLDDSTFGNPALLEAAGDATAALRATSDTSASVRAAAWNVIAMAAGPGDAWVAGSTLQLDEDPRVRFAQYKALARLGSGAATAQLKAAAEKEDDPLLAELLADSIKSGGIGLLRSRR